MNIKRILRIIRLPFVCLLVFAVYCLGCLCYDRKYLTGKYFKKTHFSLGWQWILRYWFGQKVLGKNRQVPWPVPPHVQISNPRNIQFEPDDMDNFHSVGAYFQGIAPISIGRGTMIAPGVGLITANHDLSDLKKHQPAKPIILRENCWVAMNAVILPGVTLGPHTVVGAGSIVTKSFPEGNCVLVGNPARKLKDLEYMGNVNERGNRS